MDEISWSDAVKAFDVERLAHSLHKMNVGYYFITLMQGIKHMPAPNATYDAIGGESGAIFRHRNGLSKSNKRKRLS